MSLFDRRNIHIEAGILSLGPDNIFDNVSECETVNLYIEQPDEVALHKFEGTVSLKVSVSAEDLDQLARMWLKQRKLDGG